MRGFRLISEFGAVREVFISVGADVIGEGTISLLRRGFSSTGSNRTAFGEGAAFGGLSWGYDSR